MVDWVVSQGVEGASVLDIGGGVGEIGLVLLRRGAASATTLELSTAYDEPAAALAAEEGFTGRVHRRIGDIAFDASVADPADVVVLHRVVCCYPDIERLLAAAAGHANRAVVLSHPPRSLFFRAGSSLQNAGLRLMRRQYRSYVHSPSEMAQVLRSCGFAAEHLHRGPVWQVLVARRVSTDPVHLHAEAEVPLAATPVAGRA